LGHPTHIENYGKVILIGGGVGIAELLPVAKAFQAAGSRNTAILGGRTKDLVILREEMARFASKVLVTTDDGSLGEKGVVTDALKKILDEEQDIGLVFCVGPMPMMKAVSEATLPYGIKTLVCLNSIMLDGTGMCGGCRLSVGGKTLYCCVDGPDFDGHKVDFTELMNRQKRFTAQERTSLEPHTCKIGLSS
jgi:ferredoxin--NADP+ reductase